MSGGLHQSTIDGSWNKCIHSGLAAQAGFAAVAFVQAGLEGPQDILEREGGFLAAFAGAPPSAWAAVGDALGVRWEAARLAYKLYPSCQGVHPYADCALDLRSEVEGNLDSIERIDVRIGAVVGLRLCEPAALKAKPPTPYAAKFSIPYAVSAALVRGALGPESFTQDALAEPAVIDLAHRVAYVVDEAYDVGMALRGRVEIVLADGRRITRETAASRGTPQNPWPAAEVLGKFRRNAEPVIGRDRAEAAIEAMTQLPQAAEVASIAQLFGAGADR
jgi:2-methylcitrate dehydratase PrpD